MLGLQNAIYSIHNAKVSESYTGKPHLNTTLSWEFVCSKNYIN